MDEGPQVGRTAEDAESAQVVVELLRRVAALETQVATLQQVVMPEPPPRVGAVGYGGESEGQKQVLRFAQDDKTLGGGDKAGGKEGEGQKQVLRFAQDDKILGGGDKAGGGVGAPSASLENRLGSQVFNFIGILAILFGAAWALKLAIEHGMVGPVARVILGLGVGMGLILWSERFRRKGFAAFSYSLKALGSSLLYLSLWAAFQLYGLLSAPVALAGMVGVTGWNAFMAFSQDAELLAGYALAGGLLTPVLISTGGDHETFLFSYLAAIDLGVVALLRRKRWPRLIPPALLGTVAYFIGWYARYFHTRSGVAWDGQSSETALFTLLFFGVFASVSIATGRSGAVADTGGTLSTESIFLEALLPLANAAFLALALYSVFQDSGLHSSLAWLMVVLAALFLGLMRLQRTALGSAVHLAVAVVLLTIAIPLKASGQTLTTAWLVEGLVLFWTSTRIKGANPVARQVLTGLSLAGYALGLASVAAYWVWSGFAGQSFFNANLGSALMAVGALAGAGWLAYSRDAEDARTDQAPVLLCALAAIDLVALLLTLRELSPQGFDPALHPAFANAVFVTALVGLALLAAVSFTSLLVSKSSRLGELFKNLSAVTLVGFNLIAILCVEREISALWTRSEAGLQRSLAISGFLMLYGAVLLAAGFWRRSAFVRWQALMLLLFTIAKVFLFDISGLSAGYRVASFLALGALLMTISFAYQKDWLGLKTPVATREPEASL